jgi:hypothetical protein
MVKPAALILASSFAAATSLQAQPLLPQPEPPKDAGEYVLVTKPGPMEPAEFRKMLIGRTWLSHSLQHGTQVTYISPGGKAFLWYPGNTVILESRWTMGERRDSFVYRHPHGAGQSFHMQMTAMICFQYSGTSANPVTGNRTGRECFTPRSWQQTLVESKPGDTLGLARMKSPPFPLSKAKVSIEDLLKSTMKARS